MHGPRISGAGLELADRSKPHREHVSQRPGGSAMQRTTSGPIDVRRGFAIAGRRPASGAALAAPIARVAATLTVAGVVQGLLAACSFTPPTSMETPLGVYQALNTAPYTNPTVA